MECWSWCGISHPPLRGNQGDGVRVIGDKEIDLEGETFRWNPMAGTPGVYLADSYRQACDGAWISASGKRSLGPSRGVAWHGRPWIPSPTDIRCGHEPHRFEP